MWCHFLLLSFFFPYSFETSFGECSLEIFNETGDNIPKIINIIKKETKELVKKFGEIKKEAFEIHITNNIKNFKSLSISAPEWGIAIAKKNTIIMQSPKLARISYSRFIKVLKHELNHIYMYKIPKYATMPSWFKEGIAMNSAGEFSLLHKIEISKKLWSNELIPLKKLKKINNKNITLQYAESSAAIESLMFYYGEDIIEKIIYELHLNANFKNALENSINEHYVDFEKKFDNFLNENYKWLFLLKSSKYMFIILPFILIISFYIKYFNNKKKLKIWELEEKLEN